MALTAAIRLSVTGKHTKAGDLGSASFPFALTVDQSLVDGTGNGQADRAFSDERTLAASATEDLDLAGVLADIFGATITTVEIVAVFVQASPSNNVANPVHVTRPASNGAPLFLAAGDGIALGPGEVFAWFNSNAGKAVTAGTGDLITITNGAGTNSVTYKVIVIGRSA